LKENKFIHISDLHFFRSNHLKSSKDGLSHFEIKRHLLGHISSMIQEHEVGAVLISGDLELDSADNLIPFLTEWLMLGSKVFLVFGEHDTRESRKQLVLKTKKLNGLYIFDDWGFIDDGLLNFCVSGMSCESKQNGFTQKFSALAPHDHIKPAIFLTHPCNLTKSKMQELGFTYYAVGHIHKPVIEKVDRNMFVGRPGHLYSLWDGDGKAWPVGAIIGEFRNKDLKLSWFPFPVAQTVRLFIDPHNSVNNKPLIIIENCSYEKSRSISSLIEGKWIDQNYRGIFKGILDQEMDYLELGVIIEKILHVFQDDIFVTPSDSQKMKKKYGYSRGVFTAKTLLSDPVIFEEFLERIIKASSKTQ